MTEHYPRIRLRAENGVAVVREGICLTFYMRPPHRAIAEDVLRALEAYRRRVGSEALGVYADTEGDWRELDGAGWSLITQSLRERAQLRVVLEAPDVSGSYAFLYRGRDLASTSEGHWANAMCEATYWLSTEFLEEHGPARVRNLAIEIASVLPFCSGSCGLAFIGGLDLVGVSRALMPHWKRYPGLDCSDESGYSSDIGTRLRGPHWINFVGQPVLAELGGVDGLRTRLRSPGTTVQELPGEKVVITLGEWPEAGDLERGDVLPAYRELARVLEPWLYHSEVRLFRTREETRRWERRFLD